ncbi:hypothetical protein D9M69_689070 [compost metagenome]
MHELHAHGRIQPQALAQFVALRLRRLLVEHHVDGVADEPENRERQQRHRQHDASRVEDPSNYERQHVRLP